MRKPKHINKMASNRHESLFINHILFICVLISLLLPTAPESVTRTFDDHQNIQNDDSGRRLTREYDLRQGALRGLIVKPNRQYQLQNVEMFLGIPYAAPPVGNFRFMPPASAPSWSGVKMATRFAPVCPQSLPPKKKHDPQSLGRQRYMERLEPFLTQESEDCLYLNIYVPYREQKSKKFPVLVFIHGDSFEWSSGNPYDGKILASYGNIMVITFNYRLGILGFMKPSMTEFVYDNNGLLDQLAALQWIKDNIEDLNGDPNSVTLMGHGTGAACVSFLMLSPISNGLFHRAILMSGSALSDWALTKDPTQYTLQVAQSLGCNPTSKNLMTCLQNKPLAEIRKVQILAREFETPLGAVVAGSFIPDKPLKIMASYPNLLSKYQLLCGVTEYESYHDFGAIELEHGILETQRDDFITKYTNILFEGAEDIAVKEILNQYSPSKLDPQRWNVETNRDVILNLFSDARTLAPLVNFANYHSKANRQSYFYVFGHNSVSTHYAPQVGDFVRSNFPGRYIDERAEDYYVTSDVHENYPPLLNKSVHGEELPYVLGVPLGGSNTHFHSEYTSKEKLLSEVIMRLWTNFVKIGTPNTQSVNEYLTLDRRQWNQYNIEWPEYNVEHQSYLKLDIPPFVSSYYRSNYTKFWIELMPKKMKRFIHDPLFEFSLLTTTMKPKSTHKIQDPLKKMWTPHIIDTPRSYAPTYGRVKPYSQAEHSSNTDSVYREIQSIKTSSRVVPPNVIEESNSNVQHTTIKPKNLGNNVQVKTSGSTITLIISLGLLFVTVNIGICAILCLRKKEMNLHEGIAKSTSHTRAEIGEVDVIGQKSSKDDKNALQTLKSSCSVIKSISLIKKRGISHKNKENQKARKSPRSDDSGGFRERFQLRRHLSTSTLDAHTKVRDWIANEVMHRCSPNMMRKSNAEVDKNRHINMPKPFTRSEEILSETKTLKADALQIKDKLLLRQESKYNISNNKINTRKNTSEINESTSAFGSYSTISSKKKAINSSIEQTAKSTDSLKSRCTESLKSCTVSIAIDATPSARTNSILQQEPIELTKSFEKQKHSENENDEECSESNNNTLKEKDNKKVFTNEVTLSFKSDKIPLTISHKHSTSDPVTDINYEAICKKKTLSNKPFDEILPPVIFRNDINVTSKDDSIENQPLSTAEALMTIKRRNFPKVLPDLPQAQKRLSLQPTVLQTFRSFSDSTDSESEHIKIPPVPPPRTTTLDRQHAFKDSKLLPSFEVADVKRNHETNISAQNYENVEVISPHTRNENFLNTFKLNENDGYCTKRNFPKVIIASSKIENTQEPLNLIQASQTSHFPRNGPRVKLPDDFHSYKAHNFPLSSSVCSDDDIDFLEYDLTEDMEEGKLIQEIVGGADSPTCTGDTLDSKGPATIFEKKLEVIPVKVNAGNMAPKTKEDYVCITDLQLPDISEFEKTAQIKPNYGINKLQKRSESIHRPPEKAVKVVQRGSLKPSAILNRGRRNVKKHNDKIKSDTNKLEHSNSGSSNDTEESTGTVKRVEVTKKI